MLRLFKKETVAPLVSNVESTLREGSDLLSNDAIIVNEKLTGNLFCAGEVLIAANGILSGNITAEVCTVSGVVKGNIGATDMIDLKSTAVVEGNIQARALNIDEGAIINGTIAVKEDVALTRISLLNKINSYTPDQFLSAKISAVLNDVNGLHQDKPLAAVKTQASAVAANNTIRAAEQKEAVTPEPQATEQPQGIQKELSAAPPPSKAVENTEANNRWW